MRRNEINGIDAAYASVITESKQRWLKTQIKCISYEVPTLIQIKDAILKLAKLSDWNAFVDSQKNNECLLISESVSLMFPMIDMYSVVINFSDEAISKMKPQDDLDMFTCTHYLNKYEDMWLDFGKGTNVYEDVYVLDGIDDIYLCIYANEEAKSKITKPRKEDVDALSIYLK